MKKFLLAGALAPLMIIQQVSADSLTVNVPVSVKSMRAEFAFLRVKCALRYLAFDNYQSRARYEQSDYIPLDTFGNLKRTVSIRFDTSTIPPEELHGPARVLQCEANLYNQNKDKILLSQNEPGDPTARAALINDQASVLSVVAAPWVPDEPSPHVRLLGGNSQMPANPSSSPRIR
ncbi:MAG TPA: hypothetical protein DIW43_18990 [Spongiibacteraceae bacterium]|nr:hypothetical protein [Spongiibacteraceae bacterium]MBN51745.1 hypothetical protein [Spongiibacteraceae bacterium]HCS29549.1 hypothetical protein [Spongiibacteraceae bacterium]